MNVKILLIVLMSVGAKQVFGQAAIRKLPANINHTSINNYAPYVSMDGNSIIYVADVAEDNALTLNYTARDGANWRDPIILPKAINNRLNFLKGYALSADGKTLYTTNMKAAGLGGFDIYTSLSTGTSWSEPVNIGPPINSKGHDGCPSVSTDGNMLFFMRCDKMDFNKAENCKILISKKKNGQWEPAVELPGHINTGNSQAPRILGDNETLLFSSDKILPNKGGMDLYITRLVNNQWSTPRPLDFVNTTADDQFASVSFLGRYLLKDQQGAHNSELVELLFPPDLRPKISVKLDGNITGPENLASAFVSVFDLKDQSRIYTTRPAKDGTFTVYLKEGGLYELSVDPEKDNFTFYSKRYDLTGEKVPTQERVSVTLKAASAGDEILLDGISFKEGSAEVHPSSQQELRRLVRLLQALPERSLALSVTLMGYQRDTIRSNTDLTEVHYDTLAFPVTYKVDSVTTSSRDSLVIKTLYHNDRTKDQATALGNYLISQGIPAARISLSGIAFPETVLENRKTIVKVIFR